MSTVPTDEEPESNQGGTAIDINIQTANVVQYAFTGLKLETVGVDEVQENTGVSGLVAE